MDLSDDSIRVAEDDELRSSHIRELIQEIVPVTSATLPASIEIPKVLVQFWHDLEAIPKDVQGCLESWQQLETLGFKRLLFNDASARQFIETQLGKRHVNAFDLCHHPAMRCDYFRLCYIVTRGGFYVDADELYQGTLCERLFHDKRLKLQPLCYDKASDSMLDPSVFLQTQRRSPGWIYYVNNNPIIAPRGHAVIHIALQRATEILLNCSGTPEIQSTTGPGNLSASLVRHSITSTTNVEGKDFLLLSDWATYSISPWPLSYRNDQRNWRLWDPQRSGSRL